MLGSVLSSMVNVAVVLEVFPQSSVAVKVTVSAPVAPQRSLKPALLLLQVTLPHASLATAPPLLESQAAKAAALPAPSHSTVSSAATVSMLGSVVSSMVNVAEEVTVLPQSSLAVKMTVALPVAPPLVAQRHEVVAPGDGAAQLIGRGATIVGEPSVQGGGVAGSVALDRLVGRSNVRVGAVVSSMVNVAVVEAALPQSSVAEKITSMAPVPAHVRA